MTAAAIIDHLLTASPAPAPLESLEAWWRQHRQSNAFTRPMDRAMAGGFAADRPAYAFASGFCETLQQLAPTPHPVATAFCATEQGGAHPRAIQTTLSPAEGDALRLQGHKTFTTLGTFADELLVVARTGERDGRPVLRVVRINADRAGVRREPLPPLPMVPEIPHAEVYLDAVVVQPDELLEGDGYLRYLKPLRTVEDGHVLAALVAWLVQVARRHAWPRPLIEDCVVILTALRTIAGLDPLAPATHVALEGVLRQSKLLLQSAEPQWARVDPATAERWQRDRALLDIAATARTRRAEAAWKRL